MRCVISIIGSCLSVRGSRKAIKRTTDTLHTKPFVKNALSGDVWTPPHHHVVSKPLYTVRPLSPRRGVPKVSAASGIDDLVRYSALVDRVVRDVFSQVPDGQSNI
nr:MAG: Px protein [Sobemovirus sp.]